MKTKKNTSSFGPNAFQGKIVKNMKADNSSVYEGGSKDKIIEEDSAPNVRVTNVPIPKTRPINNTITSSLAQSQLA
jgi:hypothetical protein